MDIVTVLSTRLKDLKRLIKFERRGKSDIREKLELSPYGLDSNPIEKVRGAFSESTVSGQGVVLGYVNANQKADVGEFRTYATDSNGNEVFYTWMKADGTMEIGGNADNMVRYSKLEQAFNQLQSDFDNLVSIFNAHIHTTTATIGPTPTVGVIAPTTTTGNPSTADIAPAKIDEIKTT